ncbi:MAG: hypothetical protein KGD58_18185 [Candidatus Lokiarchaeota archaeon]|nr:hypothetical protein [Candidatus Lokiarchaeota archaeon]
METEEKIEKSNISSNTEAKGHIKIDWGRQGGVIFLYLVALLCYYGIIANIMMYDYYYEEWISFNDMDRTMLFWTWTTYITTWFLPALLLFVICFALTYKEEIPHYGIKASIWLVPLIIAEGFILYAIMFGLSMEPINLKFLDIRGWIDIIVMFAIAISGAIAGMYLKRFKIGRRSI